MFIGLLTPCTVEGSDGSLGSKFKGSLKCISLNNRLYQAKWTLDDIKSNETFSYQLLLLLINVAGVKILSMIRKAPICGPNNAKNMNIKFSLI